MRYNELVNEEWYDIERDWKMGGLTDEEYYELKRKYQAQHDADERWNREMDRKRLEMPRTYFKLPFNMKDEAKAVGMRWDPDKKMWYKQSASTYTNPKFDPYLYDPLAGKWGEPAPAATPAPQAADAPAQAPAAAKPDIKMTHLHYLRMTDDQAAAEQAAGVKVKKDKKGRWYFPQYNVSGRKFQADFETLKNKYGSTGSVTLS